MSGITCDIVKEADVLRLALDGQLTLSVHFINKASARYGQIQPIEMAGKKVITGLGGEPLELIDGLRIDEFQFVKLSKETVTIDGVWDLSMWGAERIDIEWNYHKLTYGPEVEMVNLNGPLVRLGNWIAQLQDNFADIEDFSKAIVKTPRDHPDNWYPAGGLPKNSILVVRMEALDQLQALLEKIEDKPRSFDIITSQGPQTPARGGGRPMSSLWPTWVSELVALVHDEGILPGEGSEGVDMLIGRIADRLASRGLEGPARATVQETAKAVLRRLRDAEN